MGKGPGVICKGENVTRGGRVVDSQGELVNGGNIGSRKVQGECVRGRRFRREYDKMGIQE